AMPAAHGGEAAGGDRPDLRGCCLARDRLAAASPLADSVFALQCLGSMPITLGVSDDLRRRFLPKVLDGELMAAFAMTEPDAGSDVSSLTTRAVRDGGNWVLDGHKHLITNAGVADFYCVLAKTDPDAGTRGMTLFLVEAENPGLHFAGAQVLSEPHPLGELRLEACRVSDDRRLSAVGRGFHLAMQTLDRLRPTVAAAACGMAARALREALDHAAARRQFGAPLASQPMIQEKLAQMSIELDAARLLTFRAAAKADAGAAAVTAEAAKAKAFATEAAQRTVDHAVQIVGGRGCLQSHPVDRLYRAVRALRIYEGATEIQYLVIARSLAKTALANAAEA
ncbi:MAG: acyl-CoA dehydrogenase family protein, partial [Acidobacteriota bacterium]